MPELDLELVRHALRVARQHGYSEVELQDGESSFTATLKPLAPGVAIAEAVEEGEPKLAEITAGLVGFYREAKTPLQVGQHVKVGEVVAVIAALGIANDVESRVAGEVVEVLVEPNQPVEFGQPIARVRPQ